VVHIMASVQNFRPPKKNHLVDVVVDVRHALLRDADHGVRLAAARLPVGKHACCRERERDKTGAASHQFSETRGLPL
jgi:hypothetical protein